MTSLSHASFTTVIACVREAVPFGCTGSHSFIATTINQGLRSAIFQMLVKSANPANTFLLTATNPSMESVQLFLAIALIVQKSGKVVQAALSLVISSVWRYLPHNDTSWLPTPCTVNDFGTTILNRTNKNSLFNSLPTPTVTQLDDGIHAYVPLNDLIAYSLFFADPKKKWIPKQREQNITGCREAKQAMRTVRRVSAEDKLPILCLSTIWMDGYDPNLSTKSNRKGAWVGTNTLYFIDARSMRILWIETLLFASGPGKGATKEDHTCVMAKLVDEKRLHATDDGTLTSTTFTSRLHGLEQVQVYWQCVAFLLDNPERRGDFGLLGGGSNNHPYFGLSCYFNELEKPFAACNECRRSIAEYTERAEWERPVDSHLCGSCYSWSVDRLLDQGRYKNPVFKMPAINRGHPKDVFGHQFFTRPGLLTSELLLKVWEYATQQYLTRHVWSKTEVRAYMKVFCINEHTIDTFVLSCRDYMDYELYLTEPSELPIVDLNTVVHNLELKMDFYQMPAPPPLWHFCELEFACETPMHLQMNFQKANSVLIFDWTKTLGKTKVMMDLANPLISDAKSLGVSIMKVINFKTEKFGGFVAENWRAYQQLAPWSFQFLVNGDFDAKDIAWPPNPEVVKVDNWLVAQLKTWLVIHEIDYDDKSRKPELAELVKRLLKGPNVPPVTFHPDAKNVDPVAIRNMISVATKYCNSLMATDLSGIEAVNRCTAYGMHFLCLYNQIHEQIKKKGTGTPWLDKYTLLGILRAPKHFYNFPTISTLYEGGDTGEGIIKELRALSPTGIKDGWCLNLVRAYYRGVSMLHINSELFPVRPTYIRGHSDFKRYASLHQFGLCLANRRCVSLVCYDIAGMTKFGFVLSMFGKWILHMITIDLSNKDRDTNGYSYSAIEMGSEEYEIVDRDRTMDHLVTLDGTSRNVPAKFISSAIGLPAVWASMTNPPMFTICLKDGIVLNQNNELRYYA
jgi:hypothetical protein